jgi:hypothetical protein
MAATGATQPATLPLLLRYGCVDGMLVLALGTSAELLLLLPTVRNSLAARWLAATAGPHCAVSRRVSCVLWVKGSAAAHVSPHHHVRFECCHVGPTATPPQLPGPGEPGTGRVMELTLMRSAPAGGFPAVQVASAPDAGCSVKLALELSIGGPAFRARLTNESQVKIT